MEQLNDDILLHILNYLTLPDQFNIADAIPYMKPLIKSAWKNKYRDLLEIDFGKTYLEAEQFGELLKNVHDKVKVIKLFYLNLELFIQFSKLHFAETVSLRFNQTNFFGIKEYHLCLLERNFPKLKELILHGNFTGENLHTLFPNLEALSLRGCYDLTVNSIDNILHKYNLKSICLGDQLFQLHSLNTNYKRLMDLERLSCNINHHQELLFMLQRRHLPKLREIIFYDHLNNEIYETNYFYTPQGHLILIEEHVIVRTSLKAFATNPIFQQLRRLTVKNEIKYRYMMLPNETANILQNLASLNFNNLEEIILYGASFIKPEDIELLFVKSRLSLISLEYCYMGFHDFKLDMNIILAKKPLTLNWYQNFYSTMDVGYIFRNVETKSEKLNFIDKPCKLDVFGTNPLVKITTTKIYQPFEGELKLVFKHQNTRS